MAEKLKVFELVIDEDSEDSGVNMIALVDYPAIEKDFMRFSKQQAFKVQDEEQRIVSGPAMLADKAIFRMDEEIGEHYVLFTAETIKKIRNKFAKTQTSDMVNLMHDTAVSGVHIVESFLIDERRGITTPKGFDEMTQGSWFVSMLLENEEVWQQVKDGTFKGFSVEGIFERATEEHKPENLEDLFRAIEEVIGKIKIC